MRVRPHVMIGSQWAVAVLAGVVLAASVGNAEASQPAPVVATWFSVLHPVVGSMETIHVHFSKGNAAIAGASFSARLTYGKSHLDLKGGKTGRHGNASASFTVPKSAKGKVITAV